MPRRRPAVPAGGRTAPSASRADERTAATIPQRVPGGAWTWAVLLAVVFVVKIGLVFSLTAHPLLQPEGDLDAGEYWRLAQRVVGGDVLLQGTPFYVSPLYIYWLALAVGVTGGSVAGVLALQAALGTAAVWVVARVAASWANPSEATRAALVGGGALALTGVVALQEALLLQSALDPILTALLAFTLTRALQVPSRLRWAWCGAALALLATNRPNAWVLAVICVPAARHGLQERAGRHDIAQAVAATGACVLGAALVLAPFTLRTALATGEWQVLPGHGGLNVYIGNHAAANGTYTVVDGIRPSIAGQREDMRRVAEQVAGRSLSNAEVSSYFVGRSLAWWRDAPLDALRLLSYKLWLTTHSWELPINVSYTWFREQVVLLRVLPLGAWLLVPLGLATSMVGGMGVADELRGPWRWFRWLLPTYLVSVALVFVVDRYRAPALVLCAVHVGVLSSMLGTWRAKPTRRDGTALAVAALVCVAGLVPLPFQLGEAEADTRMAIHAIDSHRDEDARSWLDRAVRRHPAPGVVWLRAGLAWQARDDFAQAERALREAHRVDGQEPVVAFTLAEALIAQGKGAEAVPLLEQAERAGVRPDRTRLDLALAQWQAGDQRRARETLARGIPVEGLPLLRARALASIEARRNDLAEWLLAEHRRHAPDDAEVAERLGLVTAQRGATAAAAALFEEAAKLEPTRASARFNLAIARLQQGRRAEAIALLREALRIDPTYAQAAGALRELLGTP